MRLPREWVWQPRIRGQDEEQGRSPGLNRGPEPRYAGQAKMQKCKNQFAKTARIKSHSSPME